MMALSSKKCVALYCTKCYTLYPDKFGVKVVGADRYSPLVQISVTSQQGGVESFSFYMAINAIQYNRINSNTAWYIFLKI